jgi:hypothetical protein
MENQNALSGYEWLPDTLHAEEASQGWDALAIPPGAPPEVESLRIQQRLVLAALMAGKKYGEAAQSAGVDRRTLYNWMRHDENFRAAMTLWRQELLAAARDRLTMGAVDAAEALCHAAGAGNVHAAMGLLKGIGVCNRQDPMPKPRAPKGPPIVA